MVSHLFFADDSILFAKASVQECSVVADIIYKYERASGQKVNLSKTEVVFSRNVESDRRNAIVNVLGVKEVDRQEKYLGLPTVIGRSKKVTFACIKERIWKKLQGWKEKLLSRPGKEILIKSVAQAIPTYMMSVFCLPSGLLDEIHSLIARFWWGSNGGEKKMHWHSWESMCLPKSMGGLGFRDLHCFNQDSLAKQAWRLCQSHSTHLARVLQARYYKNTDFLDARRGYNPSFTRRSIWGAKSLLLEGLKWCVGSGSRIRVWDDAWILGNGSHCVPTPSHDSNRDLRVCDLIGASRGGWNVELIQQVFVEEEWSSILGIPLSRSWPEDHLYILVADPQWGIFCELLLLAGPLGTLPHMAFTAWGRRHKAVAKCMAPWWPSEAVSLHMESIFAKAIWQVSPFVTLLNTAPIVSFADLFEWFVEHLSYDELRIFCSLTWAAWYCRNKFIFEQQSVDVQVMACHFVKLTHDYGLYAKKVFMASNRVCTAAAKWNKPPVGLLKANFDAHMGPNGEVGLGVVVRDSNGKMVLGGVRRRAANWDVSTAEAMAGLFAVELVHRFGYTRVVMEGDSLVVISGLKNKPVGGSPIFHVFNDISRVCLNFSEISFSHVKRAGNVVAHLLARWECVANSEVVWLDFFPQSISTLAELDLL
ncbi:uncharacterized protein LOC104908875 [Beta vulgaris subsp. vulgaris]|uniref:uncharacterized protein LOC104908875 n=1 Tax=Beta vulgaris subsp. vulgaris TaxID=3555 RepID=UPI00053FAE91|nr:uncharacterized protein LOC104908875 [Beta vulgaris subsp. vulgaris]